MPLPPLTREPSLKDIEAARDGLGGHASVTPLLESASLNDAVGGRLLIKAEALQRTGSFKFRGAYNAISRLSPEQKKRGVVAFSSGNHAQGVAAAAQVFAMPATIVMPADTPALKLDNTRGYGAEVILFDRYGSDNRDEIAAAICEERGATLIRPYDNFDVIAGQGTVGLEISQQIDTVPDQILCPCGGGGLTSGVAIATRPAFPDVDIYTVEPEDFDDTAQSLARGRHQKIDTSKTSLCDALLPETPGALTFPIMKRLCAGGLTVSDAQALDAMRQAFLQLKLVLEPGGAVALAAAMSGVIDCRDRTTVIVCSGGNVEPELFRTALNPSRP